MDQATIEVDTIIEAYESALVSDPSVDLANFLPAEKHDGYERIAVELMRVGMEHAASAGVTNPLSEYQERFPGLLSNPRYIKELAFEDFRLRKHAGERVTPTEYRERFQIDTDDWGDTEDVPSEQNTLSVEDLGEMPMRLMSAIERFPTVGDKFAGFQLTREIARGTFGIVYSAIQGELARRQIVLKITCHRSMEPERLARLQHANIVPIYSVHHVDKLMAVCMPYFGERTLASVLTELHTGDGLPTSGAAFAVAIVDESHDRNDVCNEVTEHFSSGRAVNRWRELEKLSYVDACLWIAREIASGLAHAHQRGIIHQDLKPANVLMANDGRPMLLDFNAARDTQCESPSMFFVGGTLPYMGPEHLRSLDQPQPADTRSDVFSLGVLLFQLLTLRLPFRDHAWSNPARCIAERELGPPSIREAQPQASASVEAIVRRCLEPDLQRRYQSVEELREDLDRHLHHLPLRHAGNPSLGERMAKWRRRNPRLTTALKIAGAFAVVATTTFWTFSTRHAKLDKLRSQALDSSITLREELQSLYIPLAICDVGDDVFQAAWTRTSDFARMYGPDFASLESNPLFLHLPDLERVMVRQCLSELLYLQAEAQRKLSIVQSSPEVRESQLKLALRWNAQAISLNQPHQVPRVLSHQRSRLSALISHDMNHDSTVSRDRSVKVDSKGPRDEPLVGDRPYGSHSSLSLISTIEALQNGRFRKALEQLEVVRLDYPISYSTWLLMGNAHVGLGQFYEADYCYTTAAALWTSSYIPFWLRGLERLSCQRYADAAADFEMVLQLKPNDAHALLNRAVARIELKDFGGAEQDLTLALAHGATQTRLFFLRARVREKLGRQAEATSDRQEGLTREPIDEHSWIARGIARLPDDLYGALDDFQQACRSNPNSRPGLRNIAYVWGERMGKSEDALEVLNRLVSIDGAHADDIVARGVYHARLGNRQDALQDVERALAKSDSDKTQYQVACVYALTAQIESADVDLALAYLGQALVAHHGRWLELARTDPDLEPIRKDSRFLKLLHAAETYEQTINAAAGTER